MRKAGVALGICGGLLGILGGGVEKFSASSPGNPPQFVAGQGENGAEGLAPHGEVARRDRGRAVSSRSHQRRAIHGCVPSSWRAYATADERWIIRRESGGSVRAWNRIATSTGHAFGLGQLTRESRVRAARRIGVAADTVDACQQLELMRVYIHERYGSTAEAVAFWRRHGWY